MTDGLKNGSVDDEDIESTSKALTLTSGMVMELLEYYASQEVLPWNIINPSERTEMYTSDLRNILKGTQWVAYTTSHPKVEINLIKFKQVRIIPLSIYSRTN